jgi:hypothetical protein
VVRSLRPRGAREATQYRPLHGGLGGLFRLRERRVGEERRYLVSVDGLHALRAMWTESAQDGREERVVRTMIRV